MADQVLPVRFFKIILDTNLQRVKLPNKFTRIYGGGLSNPVCLKPPYGPEWEVHWTKLNGEIWFERGWQEFTQNYSLGHGCLVVFVYGGGSKFDVIILGQNALEIEYPSGDESEDLYESDDDDDESAEISVSGDESHEFPDSDYDSEELPDQIEQMRGEINAAQRTKSLNQPREARAKEVAEAFITNNPFMTLFIKDCDLVKHRKTIHCLKGYVEKEEKDVRLHVGNRSWRVRMLCFDKPPILHRQFSAGWTAFATENGLQEGDICIFELINREDPVAFRVHVTKHNQ